MSCVGAHRTVLIHFLKLEAEWYTQQGKLISFKILLKIHLKVLVQNGFEGNKYNAQTCTHIHSHNGSEKLYVLPLNIIDGNQQVLFWAISLQLGQVLYHKHPLQRSNNNYYHNKNKYSGGLEHNTQHNQQ